ncbi:MAG: hypothetical protein AB1324_03420 [Candidatus Micrarchaeota archaeon]
MPTPFFNRPVAISIIFLSLLLCLYLSALLLDMRCDSCGAAGSATMSGALQASALKMMAAAVADEDISKKTRRGPLGPILSVLGKLHFLTGLAMFVFIGLMVVEGSMMNRALLLTPVVLLFFASKVFYAIEQAEFVDGIIRRYRGKQD